MKAAILYKPYELKIIDNMIPRPTSSEMLIKTAYCGVCGTDVHLFHGDKGSVPMIPMTIPGHELSGNLVKTGERVVVDPNYFCGKCNACLNNNPHYCENIKNTGVTINGGFAEYLVAETSQIHKLPKNVSLLQGAFAEPLSCCLHGLTKISISSNDNVLIIGGGTIGLLMLQLCRYYGANKVSLIDIFLQKRKTAILLGADYTYENINAINSEKYNKVIECVGKRKTCQDAIDICQETGTVLLFGLTKPNDEITIKPFDLFKRDLTITSSYINPNTMKKAIDILATGAINVEELIGKIISLDELPDVLANDSLRVDGKVIVSYK
ncbi:MAG: zinc-dependent alcohol dehydrogenase family protein [Clostridiales bacterium]|nr:zinc-dependent alcohol dehydrogenase family protein [Clostridiales bacterium]